MSISKILLSGWILGLLLNTFVLRKYRNNLQKTGGPKCKMTFFYLELAREQGARRGGGAFDQAGSGTGVERRWAGLRRGDSTKFRQGGLARARER
jgi:hypothetical protein